MKSPMKSSMKSPMKSPKTFMRLLFPKETRTFRGKRWLKISLRTAHIIGMAGFAGAIWAGYDVSTSFLALTIWSGILFCVLELVCNAVWIVQLRGWCIVAKLGLLALGFFWPQWMGWSLLLICVISGAMSHAPGAIRYYSPIHCRRIDHI